MSQAQPSITKPMKRPTLSVVPSVDPIANFLGRLERVRKCGAGYIARCPAHDDKTASLSITAGDDGRVLAHCFAGCPFIEIVAAVHLEVADLFVRRPTSEMTWSERLALREKARESQWAAALNALVLEVTITQLAARDVRAGKTLDDEDFKRLRIACQRIDHAKEVLVGRRIY
jgi:hypothetical protein